MILDTTSKVVEVILGGAVTTNQLEITADWVDTANGLSFAPGATSLLTNGGTLVTAVAAPAANIQRQVKALTIYNADTVNQTATVRLFDGTNRRRFASAALVPGASLVFTPENGWAVLMATPGQIIGTSTNDNAAAGNVGEYVSNSLAVAGTSISSSTPKDLLTISLSAGDWDVQGIVGVNGASGTVFTIIQGWTSSASATRPTRPNAGALFEYDLTTSATALVSGPVGRQRFSLSAPTTIYLSVFAVFTVNTAVGFGFIDARRVR